MANYYEIYMNDVLIASSESNEGILNPIVNKEINTAGSCSFTVLPSHPKWGEFRRFASFIDVMIYDVCVFRGRVTGITMDAFKQKAIECEGALAFLMDTNVGAITSQNIRDKISAVLQTHNGCLNSEYAWPLDTAEKIFAATRPWDLRRTFITGIVEPEGSANLTNAPGGRYTEWFDGYINENDHEVYHDAESDRILYWMNGVDSTKIYFVCIDNLQYMQNNPNEAIVFYFYSYGTYVNKRTIYLSDINAQQVKRYSFTLENTGVSNATEAYISIPRKFREDGINFWLQQLDFNQFNYTNSEHYSETTEHGVTGETFSTLFINNREAMIRTRPLDMTKRFLENTLKTNPSEEDYVGNVIDVLNPHRVWGADVAGNQGTIKFGVNLLELQTESPDFEPVVAVRPLTAGNSLWTTNSFGTRVPLVVTNPFYIQGFGPVPDTKYPRNVKLLEVGEISGNTESVKNNTAIARANYYFNSINCDIPASFTVKALDVNIYRDVMQIFPAAASNMIDVGDPIIIVAEPYNLSGENEKDRQGNYKNVKICLALKLDILNPQNNEYTIGDYIPDGDDFEAESLTKKFAKEKKKNKKKK